jgi:hypothetical protein
MHTLARLDGRASDFFIFSALSYKILSLIPLYSESDLFLYSTVTNVMQ